MSPSRAAGRGPRSRRLRSRGAVALAVVLAVGLLVAALAAAGAGGAAPEPGPLAWKSPPRIYVAPGTPSDRILSGVVRNASGSVAETEASRIRVVARSSERLKSSGIFVGSFVRGLYAGPRKGQASDIERRRTGRLLRIGPGDEQPLTVSWRLRSRDDPAVRVEYGSGSLPVPAR